LRIERIADQLIRIPLDPRSSPARVPNGTARPAGPHLIFERKAAARAAFEEGRMSIAKVSEISATSTKSFEDAIQQGLTRSAKTLRNVRGAWIKEQHVRVAEGRITEYRVNMMVTFVLDD